MWSVWGLASARSGIGTIVGRAQLTCLAKAALLASLASALHCTAQAPAILDDASCDTPPLRVPAHRGNIRMAGPFWLELVLAKGSLNVYVTDRSGVPVDTSGGKGTATAHTDGKSTRIDLRPASGNRLAGTGKLRLKRSTVMFVTVDLRGQRPQRAVFRPLEHVTGGDER